MARSEKGCSIVRCMPDGGREERLIRLTKKDDILWCVLALHMAHLSNSGSQQQAELYGIAVGETVILLHPEKGMSAK